MQSAVQNLLENVHPILYSISEQVQRYTTTNTVTNLLSFKASPLLQQTDSQACIFNAADGSQLSISYLPDSN